MKAIAKESGQSLANVALAWVMGRPGISKTAQLTDNVAAIDLALSDAHLAALD